MSTTTRPIGGPTAVEVSINLPFGLAGIRGSWRPDRSERSAAWDLYVELVTRTTGAELGGGHGLLREALNSLHALFPIARNVLKQYGPEIARVKRGGDQSFGHLAVTILNGVIRPVLSEWHPLLLRYEAERRPGVSQAAHEDAWPRNAELRAVLADVRTALVEYTDLLARVAGVPAL
jgi:hypothetical protein